MYKVVNASESMHKEIVKVAKLTKWTKDFSNQMMFSSSASYSKGWIKVATLLGKIVGFACYREKARVPKTVLYFVGVQPDQQRKGIAWSLIEKVMKDSRHMTMELKCAKDNLDTHNYYLKKGFQDVGEDDTYWMMEKNFNENAP